MIQRRQFLGAAGALSLLPGAALAEGPVSDRRLVVLLLRGAMDGLSAAPAHGDPQFVAARAGLAPPPPGSAGGSLPLDGFFALDPALPRLHARYGKGELIVFHAIASPYRDRSHFDGQNLLENGSDRPYGLADGWLNRALLGLPDALKRGRPDLGVALAPAMPLIMRGSAPVTSWFPSVLPGPEPELTTRLKALYQATDPKLSAALMQAAEANQGAAGSHDSPAGAFVGLMTAAARFMSQPTGPCAAMIETTGWDTHANQSGPYNVLSRNFAALDQGIDALAAGLGPRWSSTAVVVVTEFGRTVARNGTSGTDHGTGGAAFLLGGAVRGGRVLADWPGLKPAALLDGRDLRPTRDVRALLKAALCDHLGADADYVERVVFPASRGVKAEPDLFTAA